MRRRFVGGWCVAAMVIAVAPAAAGTSPWALPSRFAQEGAEGYLAQRGMGPKPGRRPAGEKPDKGEKTEKGERAEKPKHAPGIPSAISAERARIMLQSLTVPGWGQASLGQGRTALAFGLIETGVWGSFTAFQIQQAMRRHAYERTAQLFAGIDLSGRDEEYRRIVGFYLSSDEYNRLVVRRDAANLYYGDPAGYNAYIAEHELRGADAWSWDSDQSLLRYRAERQATQRAARRAHTALAAAVLNRLLSVIHAGRAAGTVPPRTTSWKFECAPAGSDPLSFRLGIRADF
jgi:hypothetical protein